MNHVVPGTEQKRYITVLSFTFHKSITCIGLNRNITGKCILVTHLKVKSVNSIYFSNTQTEI